MTHFPDASLLDSKRINGYLRGYLGLGNVDLRVRRTAKG